MQGIAFQMHLKQGPEQACDEARRQVWPEGLAGLQASGVRRYSIFRRDRDLFCYMLVPDVQKRMSAMAHSEADRRWQQAMATLMEPFHSLAPGKTLAFMNEVFYMRGGESCDPAGRTGRHAE